MAIAYLASCGGTPHAQMIGQDPVASPRTPAPRRPDPDLERAAPKKLLAIDWANSHVATDADALALWKQIAPTGADWDMKLEEIPTNLPIARALAVALLREGNFTCKPSPATHNCIRQAFDVDPPAPTAGLGDPCLRRLLALWSIGQLEPDDLAKVRDALLAIVAIPPPESQLVAAALDAIPETDLDARLRMLVAAWAGGQRELANTSLGGFDEAHLITAATKYHFDGALEVLSAEGHRATYLAAVADDAMASKARVQAIAELVATADKLPADLKATLVAATKATDCSVAAMAARKLAQFGDIRFVPRRPHVRAVEPVMHALCVLASYEQLQQAAEPSLLPGFVAPRGLERVEITYDPFGEVDTDGDGDPHTERKLDLVKRDEAVLPDIDELVRAMPHCKGTTCTSEDREFRFTFKPGAGGELLLTRLESAERPPCQDKLANPAP